MTNKFRGGPVVIRSGRGQANDYLLRTSKRGTRWTYVYIRTRDGWLNEKDVSAIDVVVRDCQHFDVKHLRHILWEKADYTRRNQLMRGISAPRLRCMTAEDFLNEFND